MLPYNLKFNSEIINDSFFKMVGGILFSLLVISGLIEKFISNNLENYMLLIAFFIFTFSLIIFFNLINNKGVKIFLTLIIFVFFFYYFINILIYNTNYENFGWLYLILSFLFYLSFLIIILLIGKTAIFEKNKNSFCYDNIINQIFDNSCKVLLLFFVLWFTLSIHWFLAKIVYHAFFVLFLSLIPLFSYLYLKGSKEEKGLKTFKALSLFIFWWLSSFMVDYIIWRYLVYSHLEIDKSLGIIGSLPINPFYLVIIATVYHIIELTLIIFIAKTVTKIYLLLNLENELKEKDFLKSKQIKFYPQNYFQNLSILYLIPFMILFYLFNFYAFIIIFPIKYYYDKIKGEKIINFSKLSNSNEIISLYIQSKFKVIWGIVRHFLIISFFSAMVIGFSYAFYLVTNAN